MWNYNITFYIPFATLNTRNESAFALLKEKI